MVRAAIIVFLLVLLPLHARAEAKIALLIGNEAYASEIGRLANPHNDVALLEGALKGLGFDVTTVRDAGLGALTRAVNAYARRIQAAGPNAIAFFYYSGHGASDGSTNYLIPVDAKTTEAGELWDQSLRLTEITRKLKAEAGNATHFVVFDACRNTLKLTQSGSRAIVQAKGFVPTAQENGMLIAYATAEGELASDVGTSAGPYAKTLAEEIIKPGVESVMMFRTVQLKVKQAVGQDPWLSFPTLPAVYFAGTKSDSLTPGQQLELTFWLSVKDSTSPAVLATYLERYPDGEFAAIARALVEHYDRKLKAEQAAQEEERKRIEEEKTAAEVKRLEEERRAFEATIAEERKRVEEGMSREEEAKKLEEQQRAVLGTRTEELHKALEEARMAREAAKAAEEQRLAALKAAQEATKRAEETIALKRDAERNAEPNKADALPRIDKSQGPGQFDGVWDLHRLGPGCIVNTNKVYRIRVDGAVISGQTGTGPITGKVSPLGLIELSHTGVDKHRQPMGVVYYTGSLQGNSGSGKFDKPGTSCRGTFTAKRNSDAAAVKP